MVGRLRAGRPVWRRQARRPVGRLTAPRRSAARCSEVGQEPHVVGVVVPAGIWSRSCRLMQRRTVVGMAAKVNVRLCRLIG